MKKKKKKKQLPPSFFMFGRGRKKKKKTPPCGNAAWQWCSVGRFLLLLYIRERSISLKVSGDAR